MRSDFYLPFAKVDKAQRMVYGFASTPTKDLQDEIVTLEAIKGALPEYLPWGNIREMHQPSAVGVCKQAELIEGGNKEQEGLYIGAKIVDDDAWKKVEEGVYKGFSIGGEKVQKIGDNVTQLKLYEISIVDRPANPDCKIDYFKAVGIETPASKEPSDSSPAATSKAETGSVVLPAEPVFDRTEMGLMGRIIAKLGFGKGDGFSSPAAIPGADGRADESVVNQKRPMGPTPSTDGGMTVPVIQPKDLPPGANPPKEDVAGEIPPEGKNQIVHHAGKYHVFSKDGEHLGAHEKFDDAFDHLLAHRASSKMAAPPEEDDETEKMLKREFSDKEREHLADTGAAMPDGSFPIKTAKDLKNAIKAHGRASDPAKAKSHIIARAKDLGLTDLLPADWSGSTQGKDKKSAVEVFGLEKGLGYSFQSVAQTYDNLVNYEQSLAIESTFEGADPVDEQMANRVKAIRAELGALLAEKIQHEIGEDNAMFARLTADNKSAGKALGANDMEKRMSNSIKDSVFKGHGAVKKAIASHEKACAAHGEMHKCFGKAAEHIAKAHELHKAHFGKAAAADESNEYPHAEVSGHLQAAGEQMGKAMEHAMKAAGHHETTGDQHEVAHSHLTKATASWTGEKGEEPAAGESGYTPEAGIGDKPQSAMTEGNVNDYDPTKPYKSAMGEMQKQIEALAAELKKVGAQPEPNKGVLFDTSRVNGNPKAAPTGSFFDDPLADGKRGYVGKLLSKTMAPEAVAKALEGIESGKLTRDQRAKLTARITGTFVRMALMNDPDVTEFQNPLVDSRIEANRHATGAATPARNAA